jgi:N-acetylneuraminic acid mutarotase
MPLATPALAAEWQRLAPLPEGNAGFACGIINNEIVIAGGTNWPDGTKHWLDRIHVYSPNTGHWREAGHLPSPRAYSAVANTKEGLCLAGGTSGEITHLNLSLLGADFKTKEIAAIKAPFVYAASATLGHDLYVIGGAPDQAGLAAMTNACLAIDLSTGHTRTIAPLPVPGFVTGAATACGGKIYVFGGASWNAGSGEPANLDTAFAYDPSRNEWRALPRLPSPNRGLNAITLDATRILIAGGYKNDTEGFTADVWIFDTTTASHHAAKPLPYPALVTLITCGDNLYCLGGEDQKKHRTDACYRIPLSEYLAR